MGITYGDHLLDSGHYELTPEQEREIVEGRMGDDLSDAMRDYANEPWKYDGRAVSGSSSGAAA